MIVVAIVMVMLMMAIDENDGDDGYGGDNRLLSLGCAQAQRPRGAGLC